MKRLVVCCDGTWQTLETDYPTNVVKIAQAIKPIADDGTLQILFYDAGIGTGPWQKVSGGAFGRGIDEKILNAYRFLCFNYCGVDDEIYLFGFSRGAYTVRSLAGMISYCGLLPRSAMRDTQGAYELYRDRDIEGKEDIRVKRFREEHQSEEVKISLLACWDTVGALGIPDLIEFPKPLSFLDISSRNRRRYQFHNTTVSQDVQHAIHAMAIDEHRKVFNVTPMRPNSAALDQKLKQLWFPGEHGCVGGGTQGHRGLSDGTLRWMIDEIKDWNLGLEFQEDRVQYSGKDEPKKYGIYPDPYTPFLKGGFSKFGFNGRFLRKIVDFGDQESADLEHPKCLHESVKLRWNNSNSNYQPANLSNFELLMP